MDGLNSILDIQKYLDSPMNVQGLGFEDKTKALEPGEFAAFWKTLSDEEKQQFKSTPLH